MTEEVLGNMSALFDAMYADGGRPSIPPEKLLRAQLLQMLYSVRSDRLLRRIPSKACVAVANKNARIIWSLIAREQEYRRAA